MKRKSKSKLPKYQLAGIAQSLGKEDLLGSFNPGDLSNFLPKKPAPTDIANVNPQEFIQEVDVKPLAEKINPAILGITAVGKKINDVKAARKEQQQYLDSIMPVDYENMERYGLNTNPVFTKYGGAVKYQVGGVAMVDQPGDRIKTIVTDEDREMLKKDTYTKNLFGNQAENIYAAGFRPRTYANNQLIYTSDSNNFLTTDKKRMGYMPNKIGGLNRVIINNDGSYQNADDVNMEPGQVTSDINRFYGGRLNSLLANNNAVAKTFAYGGMAKSPTTSANMADIEAERGEAIEHTDGDITMVDPNGATHEQGGEFIPDVHRVLENTSDMRGDKNSKYLKMSPTEVKAATGVNVTKPMSHAKALEKANDRYEEARMKLVKKIELASKDRDELDKYGQSSVKLNMQQFEAIPSPQAIFDNLFQHQEAVKAQYGIQNGTTSKYGGSLPKAQVGTKKDEELYMFNNNDKSVYTRAQLKEISEEMNDAAIDERLQKGMLRKVNDFGITSYKGDRNFKGNASKYSDKEWNDFARSVGFVMSGNKSFQEYIYKDPRFKPIIDKLHKQYGDPKGGTWFDGRVGHRWDAIKEAYENQPKPSDKTFTDADLPAGAEPTPAQKQQLDTSISTEGLDVKGQPKSVFNEPLRWFDVASPISAYMAAIERVPEKYNPTEFNQLRYKLQDPTAALQQNQADYNAALGAVQGTGSSNAGVQMANIANLASRKYAMNQQVLGQYENANAQIKNQEILYNTQVRDKQGVSDQQSRELFEDKVLTSKAKQQEQKLTAMDALYKTIAENRALNRNGNLMMKFSNAFDQYGNYNGYQTKFQVNPALGMKAPVDPNAKFQPAGGIQNLTPGKSYYNRRSGKVLRFDGNTLIELK